MRTSEPRFARAALAAVLALSLSPVAQAAPAPVAAQAPATAAAVAPAARPVLSLITILPGKALYSSFGHTVLRVRYPEGSRDIIYSYGLSAHPFDAKFALGMLAGRMDFMVGAGRTDEVLDFYREVENRTIIEQTLVLSPAQADSLLATLRHDSLPDNREYNYRYFADNCTTRVAVMLEALAGGDPSARPVDPAMTKRASVYRVIADRPWLRFFLDILMGPAADAKPRPGEPIFLPEQLMAWAAGAKNLAAPGDAPFVGAAETLYEARTGEPGLSVPPLALGIALAAAAVALAFRKGRARVVAAVFDSLVFGLCAVVAAAGLLFWLGAGYEEAGWNLNFLWASPLPLIALVVGRGEAGRPASVAVFAAGAAAAALVAIAGGLGLQSISAETRLLACAVLVRCADRAGLFAAMARAAARRRA